MPGFLTNNLPMLAQMGSVMRIPVDTEFPQGANPASVAGTAFQIAGVFADLTASTAVSGAVTSNVLGGVTTTEALTTTPGSTYTLTITNSAITAAYAASGVLPQIGVYSGTNTGGTIPPYTMAAVMTLISTTVTTGQVVFVLRNDGTSALNGTLKVVWHL